MREVVREKEKIVSEIREKVDKSQIGILTDFTGLKVEDMTRLRRQIQEAEGELKVVKNTLLTRAAADESPLKALLAQFTGPNALTLGYGDPVALTKVLMKFAQDRPQFKIKAAVLSGQLLSAKDLEALSKLPPREVLLAQLLGVLNGVPTALVNVLAGVIRNLLNVLVALKDKKAETEGPAEAPAAAPAAEPEAAPAPAAEAQAEAAPEAAAEAPERGEPETPGKDEPEPPAE